MDGDHPSLSRCVVSFSFMVCSGHHISLRLLSLLRVMNIPPSQKKNKTKNILRPQAHGGGDRSVGEVRGHRQKALLAAWVCQQA